MVFTFEQATALVLPFIIGFLIGYILKQSLKLLGALVALVLILLLAGYINIEFLQFVFANLLNYGANALEAATAVGAILPFSSMLFIIGVALGFLISK